MSEWRQVDLGTVADLTVGFVGTMARHYEPAGVPFLRSQNVLQHRLDMAEVKFISEEFHRRIEKSALRPGDVVTVRTGNAGITAVVPDWLEQANCADLVITRPGPDLDARWLSYYMNSAATHAISTELVGAVQQHFNVGAAKRTRLALPPLPEQQAIADVLSALDDKISANTALTRAIDEVLRVEFLHAVSRFATEEVALGDIASVVLGGTPSKAEPRFWTDGTIPWLNSGAANATRVTGPSKLITEEALAKSAAKLMRRGTTLIAITGATLGQVARLEIESAGNQSLVGVSGADAATNDWLYLAINDRIGDLLMRATGAAQQHVSKGDVTELLVPIPVVDDRRRFAAIATPLLQSAASAEFENRTLAATRDALLPQLMSGKLRVRDAEKIAADAGL